jgi:hypothetical protein
MDALDHRSLGAKLDLWHIQDDATRPAFRAGSDKMWDWAEQNLRHAAHACGLSFSVASLPDAVAARSARR